MGQFIYLDDINIPELDVFRGLKGRRADKFSAGSYMVAESPKVIRIALNAGFHPVSLLAEEKHLKGDASDIVGRMGDNPVYTASREILAAITGYELTRGVLCALKRPAPLSVEELCSDAARIAVLESVCDSTNIGAIFRSAAALGIDGILLSPDCCDPYSRRALRVSMGTACLIPWTFSENPVARLREMGFRTIALALTENAISMDQGFPDEISRLALVLGTEGEGLRPDTVSECDCAVKIPMSRSIDSLNVAAAAAIAFWQFRKR